MIFKSGKYYVGDVCYVLPESDYDLMLEKSNYFNLKTTHQWSGKYRGYPIFVASTSYGDGIYEDNYGREYYVDAGGIGIVSAEALVVISKSKIELGNLIEFENDFIVSYDDGIFSFGDVVIDTKNTGI
ncbi:MAG: hypothetical protein U1C51_05380 [Candidatus Izemoplasmatales bacterium]|nr:hypothetical protein [Candidatus Izemoplasmatales bacterium]